MRTAAGRLLLVLLGLLLAEVGARGAFAVGGTPYRAEAVRERAREALGAPEADDDDQPSVPWLTGAAGSREVLLPHPFFGYELPSRAESITRFEVLRTTPAWEELGDPYVVLVVGGSVSQGFADLRVGGMARFEELLDADPRFEGRRLAVVGQGRSGFRQPQQLALVSWMLALGHPIDAVINLDGFNEVAFGMANARDGAHPLYPWIGFWSRVADGARSGDDLDLLVRARDLDREHRALARLVLDRRLATSCLLGTIADRLLGHLERRRQDAAEALLDDAGDDRRLSGPRFDDSDDAVIELVARNWVESSRSLHALLRDRGIAYLHVLQPTLHDEGSKPLTAEEIASGAMPEESIRGVRLGYPRLREAGEELRASGVPFVDASRVFADVEETIYIDSCHFLEDGNRILADAIARGFLASLPP